MQKALYARTEHNKILDNAERFGGTVTVIDILPTSLTATAMAGAGWTCTLANLTCTRSDALARLASYPPITLTVDVAANAPVSVTNTATVSGGGDVNAANNTASDPAVVVGPDLRIAKSHIGSFNVSQTGAYTITVTNVAPGPTVGLVTVVDTLPTALTATAIAGTGWTCTLANLTCTRSDVLLESLSYPPITVTVNVASNAPASVTNTATVSGGGDSSTFNNTASDFTVISRPDLNIAKTHLGIFTLNQVGAAYTLAVSNIGFAGSTVGTVTVVDTLPAGLTATAITGTGWNCTLASVTCTRSDALFGNSFYPAITVTVNVASNAAASVTNTATVSGGGNLNPVTAHDATTITQGPDLIVSKIHSGNFTVNQTGATYAITVSNVGNAPTTGSVSVTDTLPSGLTATAIAGSGWTCFGLSNCTRNDALAAGSSYPPITLTVTVASNAPASVTNFVTVSGGGDVNPNNNSASDPTTIAQGPDLAITKSHIGVFAIGQTGATYAITVANAGSAPTTGTVTVADSLPTGLTATAMAGTGWTCTLGTRTCTRADALAVSGSYPAITVTITVAGNTPASVTNQATVSGGSETNTANDTATDPTTVTQFGPGGALTIAPITQDVTAFQGDVATFVIKVNVGVPQGTINFTCDGAPANSTCSFQPATMTTTGSTFMTIQTFRSTSSAVLLPPSWNGNGPYYILLVLPVLGLVAASLSKQNRRKTRLRLALALSGLAVALAMVGCGGSLSTTATTPGTFHITVKATSATTAATSTVNLTLMHR